MSREQLSDYPIIPLYDHAKANEAISIATEAVLLHGPQVTIKGYVDPIVSFRPDANLTFRFPDKDISTDKHFADFHSGPRNWDLELVNRGITIPVFMTRWADDVGGLQLQPYTSVFDVTQDTEEITSGVFHLLNFPEFHSTDDCVVRLGQSGFQVVSRLYLKADGWRITISSIEKTKERSEQLRSEGGFALTHVGHIERDDATTFSSLQLRELLVALHYFLSCAIGRWSGVFMPVGTNRNGSRIFEQWGVPIVAADKWKSGFSWFIRSHAEIMSQTFPGFMRQWNIPVWKTALQHSLYSYFVANSPHNGTGIDVGLVLAQTALEQLSWTYCVLDKKVASRDEFGPRGLSAAKKLRLLTSKLRIPADIPKQFLELRDFIHHASLNKSAPRDGLDAITAVRNHYIHADSKHVPTHEQTIQAWKLSTWYLDMVYLALFGHVGKYGNRLVVRFEGESEAVPWGEIG